MLRDSKLQIFLQKKLSEVLLLIHHHQVHGVIIEPLPVLEEVEKIAASSPFARCDQLVRFLRYVVQRRLEGQEAEVKEYAIAVEVFGRNESHDCRVDPIVRMEARRLRKRLEEYYAGAGLLDPIVIDLPKGAYVPTFRPRQIPRSIGQTFLYYRLLIVLSESEAGVVYKAEDTRLRREVVLRLFSPAAAQRLRKDLVESAASLDDPHCCTILELNEHDGVLYLVTAYQEGRALKDLLSHGPVDDAEAVAIADEVAKGLWAAHLRGLTHGNLTPSNIIVANDGHAKILNLGLDGVVEADPDYQSPEQLANGHVDQRTDIWSLGAILYEMIYGRPAFRRDSANPGGNPRPGDEPMFAPAHGTRAGLSRIIRRCLEDAPLRRYHDVAELGTELQRMKGRLPRPSEQEATPHRSTPMRGWSRWLPDAAVFLVIIAVWFFGSGRAWRGWNSTPISSRFAILPFDDFTPGEQSSPLVDALTESLTTKLAHLHGFDVASRASTESLKRHHASLDEIVDRLHVNYVIEGSFLRIGDQCRVTAQLIRTADNSHLWSEQFDFPWTDIITVENAISEKVVRRIRTYVTPDEDQVLLHSSTNSAKAYEQYGMGRRAVDQFQNTYLPDDASDAERHLQNALQIDSRFAQPMIALAQLYLIQSHPAMKNQRELLSRGRSYLERALKLQPQNAAALYLLGAYELEEGRYSQAVSLSQTAVRYTPRDPAAHTYLAEAYGALGFYESAVAETSEAIRFDPMNLAPYHYKLFYLLKLRRFDEAGKVLETQRKLEPQNTLAVIDSGLLYLGQNKLDQFEQTYRSFIGASGLDPVSFRRGAEIAMALAAALKGNHEPGELLVKNKDVILEKRYLDHAILLCAALGENNLSLQLVQDSPFFNNYRWLTTEPIMAKLKHDPGYQKLAAELYQKWQTSLKEIGSTLPVPPPVLPAPE